MISNIISKLPHEAIRVTDLKLLKIDGEPKLKGLYSLIYRNTIESCMSIATYNYGTDKTNIVYSSSYYDTRKDCIITQGNHNFIYPVVHSMTKKMD